MKPCIDMMGRALEINFPPQRIISLVPSQTELLFDLGVEEAVIGITKFCVHPESWHRNKTRVGGTKQLNIHTIKSLQPDLIIANKEENTKEQIEILSAEFPVWISDIKTITDALTMIRSMGEIINKEKESENLATEIETSFLSIKKSVKRKRVAYFIWRRPWMSVGNDTFINSMIEKIGWENVFRNYDRYPEIDMEELIASNPDLILLSSEPYPFKEQHISEIKKFLPDVQVMLVDGEMFSWYGSRMLAAIEYIRTLSIL